MPPGDKADNADVVPIFSWTLAVITLQNAVVP